MLDSISLLVQMVAINDDPPSEEDIAATVRGLQIGRAGGPSGMRSENFKTCLRETTREREPIRTRREAVVSRTKIEFREGHLTEELICTTMILILKGRGGYRSIGLVEVICKTINSIINTRIRVSVSIHDDLHGLRQGRGLGTATP